MLSVIIATHESERTLVPTLAALVPGVTAGLLGEVVVADAGSRDGTAEVADIAGCRFVTAEAPAGIRLKAVARSTRSPWLLFLRAGTILEPGWIAAIEAFVESAGRNEDAPQAAVFRPPVSANLLRPALSELAALIWAAVAGTGPHPAQGLLVARRFYERLGGHGEGDDAEADLLRRIGRRRLALLPATARFVE